MTWRRRIEIGLGGAGLIALILTGILYAAVSYRPSFYRESEPPGPARQERAGQFVERSLQLRNDAANEERWEAVFSEEQVNSWLAEDLPTQFPDLLPSSIGDPRVAFDSDRATIAFTFKEVPIQGVLWAVVKVTSGVENEISLEVEQLRLGLLPLPDGILIERIRGGSALPLLWSREGGRAVAKLRLDPKRRGRSMRIEDLQLAKGWLRVAGRSAIEQPPQQAQAPPGPQRAAQRAL